MIKKSKLEKIIDFLNKFFYKRNHVENSRINSNFKNYVKSSSDFQIRSQYKEYE
jgi:hypothetical protein